MQSRFVLPGKIFCEREHKKIAVLMFLLLPNVLPSVKLRVSRTAFGPERSSFVHSLRLLLGGTGSFFCHRKREHQLEMTKIELQKHLSLTTLV